MHDLMHRLCETRQDRGDRDQRGCDIDGNGKCDSRVVRIMDIKTPGSGEVERNDWANIRRSGR